MNLARLKMLINNIRAERFDTAEKTFSSIKEPEGLVEGLDISGFSTQMKWNEVFSGIRFFDLIRIYLAKVDHI